MPARQKVSAAGGDLKDLADIGNANRCTCSIGLEPAAA